MIIAARSKFGWRGAYYMMAIMLAAAMLPALRFLCYERKIMKMRAKVKKEENIEAVTRSLERKKTIESMKAFVEKYSDRGSHILS